MKRISIGISALQVQFDFVLICGSVHSGFLVHYLLSFAAVTEFGGWINWIWTHGWIWTHRLNMDSYGWIGDWIWGSTNMVASIMVLFILSYASYFHTLHNFILFILVSSLIPLFYSFLFILFFLLFSSYSSYFCSHTADLYLSSFLFRIP